MHITKKKRNGEIEKHRTTSVNISKQVTSGKSTAKTKQQQRERKLYVDHIDEDGFLRANDKKRKISRREKNEHLLA